jgi:hypothetical protein
LKRREILKYTALITGTALSTPLILSLSSCKTDSKTLAAQGELHFFNVDQMPLVRSIIDTILPKTDSPSASDVGVHQSIDQMVGLVYKKDDQITYAAHFEQLSAYINKAANNKPFSQLTEEERLAVLQSLSKSNSVELASARAGLSSIKQQTIAYYLNTEEIATTYLNYLPVPGPYVGCISLESVGSKAWAI